jgi:hypothetical protein
LRFRQDIPAPLTGLSPRRFNDHAIYSVGFILSGHTLKHFAAAGACFAILRYFQTRRFLDPRLGSATGRVRKDVCRSIRDVPFRRPIHVGFANGGRADRGSGRVGHDDGGGL